MSDQAQGGAATTTTHRALVVIDEAVSGRELTRALTERLEDGIEAFAAFLVLFLELVRWIGCGWSLGFLGHFDCG